jgi:N-acetylglucosaminyltransferase
MALSGLDVSSWLPLFVSGGSLRAAMPLGLAGVVVWSLWLYRAISSRYAGAIVNDFRTTTSVVVPSFREDPAILMSCLKTWLAEDPSEVIIVVDIADIDCQVQLATVQDPRLKTIVFAHEGKRSALGVGIRVARSEIVVMSDSDTMWTGGLLANVQMPFKDPEVGAVGTEQRVYQRTSSVWRRIADWMVCLRYNDYVPAMGRKGAVICVSGRTAAYRRSVIVPLLPNLEHEFFLGRRCIAGDDGRLTWLVLAPATRPLTSALPWPCRCFPTLFAPSSSSGCAGAATRPAPT